MKWDIQHRTRYRYAAPVHDSFNEVRLQPVDNEQQAVESFLLKVLPATRLRHYHDFNSNVVHHFELPAPHDFLAVESHAVVEVRRPLTLATDATPFPLERIGEAARAGRVFEFLAGSRFVDLDPEIWRLAVDATQGQPDTWQSALAILRFVHGHITYAPRATHAHTHMREVLMHRRGVCQDFAHVMIGLCRTLRIPALYVSGYLATENASATHAWVEVFVPGHGWLGVDPTHNRPVDETYVKVAIGRDYGDVPPVSGHYKGTQERTMEVEVEIRPAVPPGS